MLYTFIDTYPQMLKQNYMFEPVAEKHRSWLEEIFSAEDAQKCIDGWNSSIYKEDPEKIVFPRIFMDTNQNYIMYQDLWYQPLDGGYLAVISGRAIHPDYRDRGATFTSINMESMWWAFTQSPLDITTVKAPTHKYGNSGDNYSKPRIDLTLPFLMEGNSQENEGEYGMLTVYKNDYLEWYRNQ